MTQRELNRAIARATGESVSVISSMGFVPLSQRLPECKSQTVNWGRGRRRPKRFSPIPSAKHRTR
jgi:hypothetical protein